MRRWPTFALVVFVTAFVANVIVVGLWPDSDIDWATALVTAVVVSISLTLLHRGPEDSDR